MNRWHLIIFIGYMISGLNAANMGGETCFWAVMLGVSVVDAASCFAERRRRKQ